MSLCSTWRALATGCLDLFFEARCVLCDAPSSESCAWLCEAHSLRELALLRPTCPLCARGSSDGSTPCGSCAEAPPPWERLVAALAYAGAGRELLLQAKLGHRRESLRPLADALGLELASCAWARRACFVPVPLHRERRRTRGFNQAEILASELAERFRGRVARVLQRVRATVPQGDPATVDRAANVRQAFATRRFARVPASVVLVDDTCTSMATLRACAEVLRRAGVSEIRAAVVFRAGASMQRSIESDGAGARAAAP